MLAAALAGSVPLVEVGLERIEAERGGSLRGRRIGLVAHAASVTRDGRHALAVLRESGVQVVRLFAPEHGFASQAAAGAPVADAREPGGLEVVSLYGARHQPSPHDLRGLDALVVDLQGAGVRFYTYASTLLLCLEAAQQAGIPLVVLDRPNPLGGDDVAGPEAEPGSTGLLSLAPGPLLHGLTLGELARHAARRAGRPEAVEVVAMRGWRRSMRWPETGRTWVPPSPNLRSAEAALAYPGTCLLEATTLSEGRGSDAPFLLFGGPALESERLASALRVPGYGFAATRFTPRASPAAPAPKLLDRELAAVRVEIADPNATRPWELGVRLLVALRELGAMEWREPAALDRLLGTPRVRQRLEAGATAEAILAADAEAVQRFRRERRASLLY